MKFLLWLAPVQRVFESQRGFSLMEVSVAIGVMGIMATAGLSLSEYSSRLTQNVNTQMSMDNIDQRLRVMLENSDACYNSLGDSPNNTSPVALPNDNSWRKVAGVDGAGAELKMEIPLLGAGNGSSTTFTSDTTANNNYLPNLGLKIDRFYLKDAIPTGWVGGGQTEYIGRVYLQISRINGIAKRPKMISGLIFKVDNGTRRIKACRNSFSKTTEEFCKSLDPSCTYDPTQTISCTCPRPLVGCLSPEDYPVDIVNGTMICKPLGGGDCPAGSVLIGVSLGQIVCMKTRALSIQFLTATTSLVEGGATASLTVVVSEPQTSQVVVPINIAYPFSPPQEEAAQPADYVTVPAASGGVISLTIPSLQNSAVFTVRAQTDAIPEANQKIRFTINVAGITYSLTEHLDITAGDRLTNTVTIVTPHCTAPAYNWSGGNCVGTGPSPLPKGSLPYTSQDTTGPWIGSADWSCSWTGVRTGPTNISCGQSCDCQDAAWQQKATYPLAPTTAAPVPHNGACSEVFTNLSGVPVVDEAFYCNNGSLVTSYGTSGARNNTGHSCYANATTLATVQASPNFASRSVMSQGSSTYHVVPCP